MTNASIPRTETYDNDVTVEFLEDDIVIFSANSTTRKTVDTWAENVIRITSERRYNVRYIHDLSHIGLSLSSYAQTKSKEVNAAHPDAKGFVVVIMPRNVAAQVLRFFINHQIAPSQPDIKIHVTFTRAEALEWLHKKMGEVQSIPKQD